MSKWWECTDLNDLTGAGCDGWTLYLFSEHAGQVTCRLEQAQKVIVSKRPDGMLAGLSVRSHWRPEYGTWVEAERSPA
jgi:hypothetical protein